MSTRKARILAASVILGLVAVAALPGEAAARGGYYYGPSFGVFVGPPAPYWGPRYWGPPYWGPPPVYYAPPPPAYYVPPPPVYYPPPVAYPPGTPYIPGYRPITPPPPPPPPQRR